VRGPARQEVLSWCISGTHGSLSTAPSPTRAAARAWRCRSARARARRAAARRGVRGRSRGEALYAYPIPPARPLCLAFCAARILRSSARAGAWQPRARAPRTTRAVGSIGPTSTDLLRPLLPLPPARCTRLPPPHAALAAHAGSDARSAERGVRAAASRSLSAPSPSARPDAAPRALAAF